MEILSKTSVNPSGAAIGGFAAAYLVGVPITSFITKPEGVLESLVQRISKVIPGGVAPGRTVPALSALYIFMTFGASGAFSAAGQAMGREEGKKLSPNLNRINSLIIDSKYCIFRSPIKPSVVEVRPCKSHVSGTPD